jgi:hypothetical protein
MKVLFVLVLALSSVSSFSDDAGYKVNCKDGWVTNVSNSSSTIESLISQNAKAGFPNVVSVNWVTVGANNDSQIICVTSKK